jgi:AcrR family transcriptional regulator
MGNAGLTADGSSLSTRDRILRAGIELFYFEGFGGAALRDIAELASINVASIYHYFPSKQDLLVEIIQRTYAEILAEGREAASRGDGPGGKLVALTHHHVVFHALRWQEVAIGDRELGSVKVNVRKPLVDTRDTYEQLWDRVLRDGIDAGVFAVDDRHVTRIAIITMCSSVANWFQTTGRLDVDEVARIYSRLVLRMVTGRTA